MLLTEESCLLFAFPFEEPINPLLFRRWRWHPWVCGAKEIRNRSVCGPPSHFSQLFPSTWLKFSIARREGTSVSCKGNTSGELASVAGWHRQNRNLVSVVSLALFYRHRNSFQVQNFVSTDNYFVSCHYCCTWIAKLLQRHLLELLCSHYA